MGCQGSGGAGGGGSKGRDASSCVGGGDGCEAGLRSRLAAAEARAARAEACAAGTEARLEEAAAQLRWLEKQLDDARNLAAAAVAAESEALCAQLATEREGLPIAAPAVEATADGVQHCDETTPPTQQRVPSPPKRPPSPPPPQHAPSPPWQLEHSPPYDNATEAKTAIAAAAAGTTAQFHAAADSWRRRLEALQEEIQHEAVALAAGGPCCEIGSLSRLVDPAGSGGHRGRSRLHRPTPATPLLPQRSPVPRPPLSPAISGTWQDAATGEGTPRFELLVEQMRARMRSEAARPT
uniref:Uncharacterized protein n=1 Tax=Emiliania huxleyi TaxID=2903 RepID=A0A7S3TDZ4_EMIHU|mmetsp:Transcript_27729/g.83118  ORF Transcript_27729/g.83118 Transcript_27729/m.83118 type:complete len:295 (+) Transcript_27729:451-1335(+)